MALSGEERAALAELLVQLTTELESLSARTRLLAQAIRDDRPPAEDGQQPPPDD